MLIAGSQITFKVSLLTNKKEQLLANGFTADYAVLRCDIALIKVGEFLKFYLPVYCFTLSQRA